MRGYRWWMRVVSVVVAILIIGHEKGRKEKKIQKWSSKSFVDLLSVCVTPNIGFVHCKSYHKVDTEARQILIKAVDIRLVVFVRGINSAITQRNS